MAWSWPHTFADGPGNTASGAEVMDNFNALVNAFLKLAVTGDFKVKWGRFSTPAFGGAVQQAGNIPHGMGVTPAVVFLFTQQGSTAANPAGVPVVASRTTVNGTNIGYLLRNADGSNSSTGTIIDWLAIG